MQGGGDNIDFLRIVPPSVPAAKENLRKRPHGSLARACLGQTNERTNERAVAIPPSRPMYYRHCNRWANRHTCDLRAA